MGLAMCIYIYTDTHAYVYVCACIYAYVYMCIYVCVHAHMYPHTHPCMLYAFCVYMQAYVLRDAVRERERERVVRFAVWRSCFAEISSGCARPRRMPTRPKRPGAAD